MFVCYSGTGNSYYACKKLRQALGGRIVDIARRVDSENYSVALETEETLGIVFPVYFGTVPKAVRKYISGLKITGKNNYVYAVATCSSGSGYVSLDLKEIMGEKAPDACFTLIMPNNALVWMEKEDRDTVSRKLSEAEKELERIADDVKNRRTGEIRVVKGDWKPEDRDKFRKMYEDACDTSFFEADGNCIGCKFCERLCPERAIKVYGKTPVWEKDSCSLCMGCADMCPHGAITYDGKYPSGRYFNESYYLRSIGIAMPMDDKRTDAL